MSTNQGSARPARLHKSALEAADLAYRSARYETALVALNAVDASSEAFALRATILRHIGKHEDALQEAYRAVQTAADQNARAYALCVVACVHIALGDIPRAKFSVESAAMEHPTSNRSRAKIGFFRALVAYASGDDVEAERELIEAYRAKGFRRAIALQLHAFILASREENHESCKMLLRAVEELDQDPHVEYYAHCLHNISFIAGEIDVEIDLHDIRGRLRRLPWTGALHTFRFWSYRNFGLRLALDGGVGVELGLSMLHQSADYAMTSAQRTLALLDSAQVAFHVGEPQNGMAFLRDADDLARTVNWSEETSAYGAGNERLALLIAAELYAPINPDRAAGYLRMYDGLPPMHATMTLSHDRRRLAIEDHARGVVSAAIGDTAHAIASLQRAMETFERIAYKWRAAASGLRLHEITKEDSYRARAEALIRPSYPKSWIAEILAKIRC